MPLPVLLHAAAAKLTGEYLVSGKLLGYAAMAALLGLVFVLLARLRCPLPIAVALVATIVATRTAGRRHGPAGGHPAAAAAGPGRRGRGPHARGPPRPSRRRPAATALFKAQRGLGALAIVVWLLATDRRRLAWFAAAYGAFAMALLVLFIAASDGRILENVFGIDGRGPGHRLGAAAPYVLVRLLVEQATGAWVLLPAVAVAGWLAFRERRPTIWLVSLVCCVGVLLVVLTDVGTGWNQLIDPVVLTVLVVGELAGRRWPDPVAAAVSAIIAIVLLWVNLGGLAVTIAPDLQPALADLRGARHYSPEPLAGRATATPPVRGSLRAGVARTAPRGPRPVHAAPHRAPGPGGGAAAGRPHPSSGFELVVLVVPLQPVDQQWWSEVHFGRDVAQALADSYEPDGAVEGYLLYRPAPTPRSEDAR